MYGNTVLVNPINYTDYFKLLIIIIIIIILIWAWHPTKKHMLY